MLKLLGKVGHLRGVACSGGVDSMALLHFLRRANPEISAVYFHHGTEHGEEALRFLSRYCGRFGIPLLIGRATEEPPEKSLEEWFRNQRYGFLDGLNMPLATAHHLDDVVETYLFSTLHGKTKIIPYRRGQIVRPFLKVSKDKILRYARRYEIEYVTDPSNVNLRFMRNRIRHKVVPECLKVNPGLRKVVARLVSERGQAYGSHC